MISTVIAKIFHIHILHYLTLKPGKIDKTGTIIRIFQIKKIEISGSLSGLPKITQQTAELCLKLRAFRSWTRLFIALLHFFCVSVPIGKVS